MRRLRAAVRAETRRCARSAGRTTGHAPRCSEASRLAQSHRSDRPLRVPSTCHSWIRSFPLILPPRVPAARSRRARAFPLIDPGVENCTTQVSEEYLVAQLIAAVTYRAGINPETDSLQRLSFGSTKYLIPCELRTLWSKRSLQLRHSPVRTVSPRTPASSPGPCGCRFTFASPARVALSCKRIADHLHGSGRSTCPSAPNSGLASWRTSHSMSHSSPCTSRKRLVRSIASFIDGASTTA